MTLDTLLPICLFCIFLLYHLLLSFLGRRKPLITHQGRSNKLRREWVNRVMTNQEGILAIQTLRNWTMAATFLASTAILIAFGTLNMIITTETAPVHIIYNPGTDEFWAVKLFILSGNFVFAFFNFALAIRYYNHAGFLLHLSHPDTLAQSIETATKTVNKGAIHYMLGMRHYYLSVPLVCWIFGMEFLLLAGAVLLVILYMMDYRH